MGVGARRPTRRGSVRSSRACARSPTPSRSAINEHAGVEARLFGLLDGDWNLAGLMQGRSVVVLRVLPLRATTALVDPPTDRHRDRIADEDPAAREEPYGITGAGTLGGRRHRRRLRSVHAPDPYTRVAVFDGGETVVRTRRFSGHHLVTTPGPTTADHQPYLLPRTPATSR